MTERLTFSCAACGWESRPPAGVEMVFHPCSATRTRRQLRRTAHRAVVSLQDRTLVDREEIQEADRERWREESPVVQSLETVLGEAALRSVD
ncbi:MAG: hypothetical protein ACLFWH_05255 [Actinomycetota bacterium]